MSCDNLPDLLQQSDSFEHLRESVNGIITTIDERVCTTPNVISVVASEGLSPREACVRFLNGESAADLGGTYAGHSTDTTVLDVDNGFIYSASVSGGNTRLAQHNVATEVEEWNVTITGEAFVDGKVIDGFLRVVTDAGNLRKFSLVNGAEVVPDLVSLTADTIVDAVIEGGKIVYTSDDGAVNRELSFFDVSTETNEWTVSVTIAGGNPEDQLVPFQIISGFIYATDRSGSNREIQKIDVIDGSFTSDAVWPIDIGSSALNAKVRFSPSEDAVFVTDGRPLFQTDRQLRKFSASTGSEILTGGWPFDIGLAPNDETSYLDFKDDVLIYSLIRNPPIISSSFRIYRVDPSNADIIWEEDVNPSLPVHFFIDNDDSRVYFGTDDGDVRVIEIAPDLGRDNSWSFCSEVVSPDNSQILRLRYRLNESLTRTTLSIIPEAVDDGPYNLGAETIVNNSQVYQRGNVIFSDQENPLIPDFSGSGQPVASLPKLRFESLAIPSYNDDGPLNQFVGKQSIGFQWNGSDFIVYELNDGGNADPNFTYVAKFALLGGGTLVSSNEYVTGAEFSESFNDYGVSKSLYARKVSQDAAIVRIERANEPHEVSGNPVQESHSYVEGGVYHSVGRFAREAFNSNCNLGVIPIPRFAATNSPGTLELTFTLTNGYSSITDPTGVETIHAKFYVVPGTDSSDITSYELIPVEGISGSTLLNSSTLLSGSKLNLAAAVDPAIVNTTYLDGLINSPTDDTIQIIPIVGPAQAPVITSEISTADHTGIIIQNKVGPTDTLNLNDGTTQTGGSSVWMICSYKYSAPVNGGGSTLGPTL